MKLFKKKDPLTVEVKGHSLVCPICSNNLFITKDVRVHKGLLSIEWSKTFVCSECTYVFWFWS
jgi:C4-type Zn-finger protein